MKTVNAGLLEVLCEPVYKEVEKRGEFIGLPVAPPSQITKEGSTPILKLCENGDIFVKGKLIKNLFTMMKLNEMKCLTK